MSEQQEHDANKDPEPIKHVDAERVTSEEDSVAEEIENDPAYNPQEQALRDLKGG